MGTERRAVIDVGTNSVKLLVADVTGTTVHPVTETSEQTRLGAGFYPAHRLHRAAIERTAVAVARFSGRAREHGADWLRVLATSAARDALNQADLVTALRQACRMEPEIISGEQEADWAFRGVKSDPRFAGRQVLILDVGGGSTEFVLGCGEHPSFRQSFPIGSVRLLEHFRPGDPPTSEDRAACRVWLHEFFVHNIERVLTDALTSIPCGDAALVGTGGTPTILARMQLKMHDYQRERIESVALFAPQVEAWMSRLWSLTLAQRRRLEGLPSDRADVILTGMAIVETVMARLRCAELLVSTRGLRFGALLAGEAAGRTAQLDTPPPPAESRPAP